MQCRARGAWRWAALALLALLASAAGDITTDPEQWGLADDDWAWWGDGGPATPNGEQVTREQYRHLLLDTASVVDLTAPELHGNLLRACQEGDLRGEDPRLVLLQLRDELQLSTSLPEADAMDADSEEAREAAADVEEEVIDEEGGEEVEESDCATGGEPDVEIPGDEAVEESSEEEVAVEEEAEAEEEEEDKAVIQSKLDEFWSEFKAQIRSDLQTVDIIATRLLPPWAKTALYQAVGTAARLTAAMHKSLTATVLPKAHKLVTAKGSPTRRLVVRMVKGTRRVVELLREKMANDKQAETAQA